MANSILLLLAGASAPWPMHIIDNGSKGADGVRLGDVNADGLLDIVTGWEEGGDIRICINPGAAASRSPWKAISVGRVTSPEDAVLVDIDGDGALDVVSSTEGDDRTVFVHRNPGVASFDKQPWKVERVPALAGKAQWMYCLPLSISGGAQPDLIFGAKNNDAQIGWVNASAAPHDVAQWTWHPLRPAGWIMSLIAQDMNGDGRMDILFSDRRGDRSGVYWLERPQSGDTWKEHKIGLERREVMFITTGDLDADGDDDVVAAVKPREIAAFYREDAGGDHWRNETIPYPATYGTAKAARIADIDGDGRRDLVVTCEQAETGSGVFWLSRSDDGHWSDRDIAGPAGIKYDLVEPIDLDGDGDLDALTCEEREINAVIWYENPGRDATGPKPGTQN